MSSGNLVDRNLPSRVIAQSACEVTEYLGIGDQLQPLIPSLAAPSDSLTLLPLVCPLVYALLSDHAEK